MSDFEEILVTEQPDSNGDQWGASGYGDWVYISDQYTGKDGGSYTSKSKKGNPFMLRVKKDRLLAFAKYALEVNKRVNGDDAGGDDCGF